MSTSISRRLNKLEQHPSVQGKEFLQILSAGERSRLLGLVATVKRDAPALWQMSDVDIARILHDVTLTPQQSAKVDERIQALLESDTEEDAQARGRLQELFAIAQERKQQIQEYGVCG